MYPLFKAGSKTIRLLKEDPLFFAVPALLDFLFVILILFLLPYTGSFYTWVSMLFIFLIFQGTVWWITNRRIFNRSNFFLYHLKFGIVTLISVIIVAAVFICTYLVIKFPLVNLLLKKSTEENIMTGSFFGTAGFLAYFLLLQYVLISKFSLWKSIRESLRIGLRKILSIVSMYSLVILSFLIFDYLLKFTNNISSIFMTIVGIILFFPLISISRIFITNTIKYQ